MSSILPQGLDTLRFFTGNGAEIQMRKQFSLEWEIIPADQVYRAFYRNPKGHVEAGRPESLNAYFDELRCIRDDLHHARVVDCIYVCGQ